MAMRIYVSNEEAAFLIIIKWVMPTVYQHQVVTKSEIL